MRALICAAALAASLSASGAWACDMHGDFGFDLYGAYPSQQELDVAAAEAARQETQQRAMTQARAAFLNRFDVKVDDPAPVVAAYQPVSRPSSDADRSAQSQTSDR